MTKRKKTLQESIPNLQAAIIKSPAGRKLIKALSTDIEQAKHFYNAVSDGGGTWPAGLAKKLNIIAAEVHKKMELPPGIYFPDKELKKGIMRSVVHRLNLGPSGIVIQLFGQENILNFSPEKRKQVMAVILDVLREAETARDEREKLFLGGSIYGLEKIEIARLTFIDVLKDRGGDNTLWNMLNSYVYASKVPDAWEEEMSRVIKRLHADKKIRKWPEDGYVGPDLYRLKLPNKAGGGDLQARKSRAAGTVSETGNLDEPLTETQNEIMAILKGCALTADAIENKIKMGRSTVRTSLRDLKEKGLIKNKRGLGYYRLDALPPKP